MRESIIVGALFMLVFGSSLPSGFSQIDMINRRNLVIDLGDGVATDAQLTFPAVGKGPFPGVLLIHGSGNTDMDEYLPPEITGTGRPVRPFLQIAEYLSERGFAVLRYNKRGVGLNGTIIDRDTFGNATFQDLVSDADKALSALKQQPEVKPQDITIIGHSEGTIIGPRVAVSNPADVKKLVLLSAAAWNLTELVYWQVVNRSLLFAEQVLDINQDRMISVEEVNASLSIPNIQYSPLGPPQGLLVNGTFWTEPRSIGGLTVPALDTNNDGLLSIEELEAFLLWEWEQINTEDPESPSYSVWWVSHKQVQRTLSFIGNVSASILIQQGENDTQTPVEQAFMLEQRLTEINHPDHAIITYPGLGHSFFPANGWIQPLGPIQPSVLSDLVYWLKDPARNIRYLIDKLNIGEETLQKLQSQSNHLNPKLSGFKDAGSGLDLQESQLAQAAPNTTTRPDYTGTSIIVMAAVLVFSIIYRRSSRCYKQLQTLK